MKKENIMSLGNLLTAFLFPLWIIPFIWVFPFILIARLFTALGKYNESTK